MKLKELFELTKNEQVILEVFIQKGVLTTGDITQNTGISRPNCYDILNKLIKKNLITKLNQNNQIKYSINSLDYQEILNKKKQELLTLKSEINNYNERIKLVKSENLSQHNVEVYSGSIGLQKFINQSFNTKKITTFGAEGILEKRYPYIWNVWIRKLKEKKIPLYVIYNEKSRYLRKKIKISVIKEKYIDRKYITNVTTQIMDEQVNLFYWDEIPLVIVIKSKPIAKAYREEFNLMWKNAKH